MVGFEPQDRRELPKSAYGFAGACSGIITRTVAQPLDVIKIRFQLQVEPISKTSISKYHGMLHGMRRIFLEEGLQAFWKGHVPAQILSQVFGIVQFGSFEILTKNVWVYLPSYFTIELRPFNHAACGGVAGCLATVAAQPFDVLRTRFVAQGQPKLYRSLVHAAQCMVTQEGVRSLYKGLAPTLLLIGPQTGFQFGFYSTFNIMWNTTVGRQWTEHGGGVQSFLCGSAAGLCAKMAIYPLDLVKKRLQVQGFADARSAFGETHTYTGLKDCMQKIVKKEGFVGLYKGISPSIVKAIVSVGINFSVYEQCCSALQRFYGILPR